MNCVGLRTKIFEGLPIEVRSRIEIISNWNFTSVRNRVARRMGWSPSFTGRVEKEYGKFISLSVLHPEKDYGMAGVVDEFWHEHLVDTQNYIAMCDAIIGKIIHHIPLDTELSEPLRGAYFYNTLPDLKLYFRNFPSEIWPTQLGALNSCRSCATCNSGISPKFRPLLVHW